MKKQKRGEKGTSKLNSLVEKHDNEQLHEKSSKVDKCEDAMAVIREYKEIIPTKKKNI